MFILKFDLDSESLNEDSGTKYREVTVKDHKYYHLSHAFMCDRIDTLSV